MTMEQAGSLTMWSSIKARQALAFGFAILASSVLRSAGQAIPDSARRLLEQRETLNRTVWQAEQIGQRYEVAITWLWDQLRTNPSPLDVITKVDCSAWQLPAKANTDMIGLGAARTVYSPASPVRMDHMGFVDLIKAHLDKGYQLVECEFHHTSFAPAQEAQAARSTVSFLLHVEDSNQRLALTGEATVLWTDSPSATTLTAEEIRVETLKILTAAQQPGFVHAATFERRENEYQSAHPVLLNDLDQDGDSEIVIPRWNRRYDNQLSAAKPQLADGPFLTHWKPQEECGLLADINGDGNVDYVTVVKNQGLTLYLGASGGVFPDPGEPIFQHAQLLAPLAITAGDIDADGDVDLWLTQYKPSYVGGQMPTPFYDANDGYPSFLLLNDNGRFTDVTEAKGLAPKRFRRTYSTSFVDLDEDNDLDLVVVSDYAGLDVYQNDGKGKFADISSQFSPNRLFGMAHSVADYNEDGQLDLLAIGMSSSTARRLDSLNLGRPDRRDYQEQRTAMGYGNRMYLRKGNAFVASPHNSDIARTGWSWGVSSFDFDNDGRRDIYVANGFRSGKSSKDYCSNYWCHDLYTGNSEEDAHLLPVFEQTMLELNQGLISWNGFEHNHLKRNLGGGRFENVAFLHAASFEYDARVTLTEDFDRDGREDLLVSEYPFLGRGFQSKIHLYLNRIASEPNRWIEILLQPSEKHAVLGAQVILETDRGRQRHPIVAGDAFLSQDAYSAHFGIGPEANVNRVIVRWPDGETLTFENPETNRVHVIRATR